MPLTRIVYHEYEIHSDQTGWYIKEYASLADLQNEVPCDVVGPYATQAAARRAMEDNPEEPETSKYGVSKRKPYDPSRDPTPAIEAEAGDVHVELLETEELRDVPPEIQGD